MLQKTVNSKRLASHLLGFKSKILNYLSKLKANCKQKASERVCWKRWPRNIILLSTYFLLDLWRNRFLSLQRTCSGWKRWKTLRVPGFRDCGNICCMRKKLSVFLVNSVRNFILCAVSGEIQKFYHVFDWCVRICNESSTRALSCRSSWCSL